MTLKSPEKSSVRLPLPAVNRDGVVAGLLLLLLHGCDDVDHALTVSGDAHLRPAVEMELTHRSSLVLLERRGGFRYVLKGISKNTALF